MDDGRGLLPLVARLLGSAHPLPGLAPDGENTDSLAGGGKRGGRLLLGCPRPHLEARRALVRDGSELFARLDTTQTGRIAYQDFVERMLALPRESLHAYGLRSDSDIVRFASQLWDFQYGGAATMPWTPAAGGEAAARRTSDQQANGGSDRVAEADEDEAAAEEAVHGRAPSHVVLHEFALDHDAPAGQAEEETQTSRDGVLYHAGPQGRCTVSADTRASLTLSAGHTEARSHVQRRTALARAGRHNQDEPLGP